MYPKIYRALRLVWPGGLETRRHLRQLERTQSLPPEEFQAFQLAQLQAIVRHAYEHVPFYRNLYRREGIHPDDIRTLSDFRRLPIITKSDVRANVERMLADNVPRDRLVANQTGGSTGEPLHFFVTDNFWWNNAANEFRVRRWHSVQEGERMAWLWGDQRDAPDWSWKRKLRARLMNHRFLNAFSLTEAKMEAFARLLQKWQPKLMMGYSTTLFLFARFLQARGITNIRPRIIEATAEKLWLPQRRLIESVFQCPVIDHYSSREMGTMAYQCEAGSLHALDDLCYLEIIADGQPAAPGQLGRVVVTSFHHRAMPFIRYTNDDMAIYNGQVCACGRSLSTWQEIVGRTNDYLVTADGQFIHSEFFAYLLRVLPEVFSYQVHQPDIAHLNVKVVCNQPVGEAWIANIRQQIQERFGPDMHVSLEVVDDIPLTPSGKHRYIISEVQPDFD